MQLKNRGFTLQVTNKLAVSNHAVPFKKHRLLEVIHDTRSRRAIACRLIQETMVTSGHTQARRFIGRRCNQETRVTHILDDVASMAYTHVNTRQ